MPGAGQPHTEAIDKLFLELSQFTQATTGKEKRLLDECDEREQQKRKLVNALANTLQSYTDLLAVAVRRKKEAKAKEDFIVAARESGKAMGYRRAEGLLTATLKTLGYEVVKLTPSKE